MRVPVSSLWENETCKTKNKFDFGFYIPWANIEVFHALALA